MVTHHMLHCWQYKRIAVEVIAGFLLPFPSQVCLRLGCRLRGRWAPCDADSELVLCGPRAAVVLVALSVLVRLTQAGTRGQCWAWCSPSGSWVKAHWGQEVLGREWRAWLVLEVCPAVWRVSRGTYMSGEGAGVKLCYSCHSISEVWLLAGGI